jgi:hypothetical protein
MIITIWNHETGAHIFEIPKMHVLVAKREAIKITLDLHRAGRISSFLHREDLEYTHKGTFYFVCACTEIDNSKPPAYYQVQIQPNTTARKNAPIEIRDMTEREAAILGGQ